MAKLTKHQAKMPFTLSPWKRYRQAKQLFTFGRMTDVNWHLSASEQPFVFHIWTDAQAVKTWVYDRVKQSWHVGPQLAFRDVNGSDSDHVLAAARSLITGGLNGRKVNALGIVFHAADEFAISQVRENMIKDRADYLMAETLIETDPTALVFGEPVDANENSWRIFPVGGEFATGSAIRMSNSRVAWLGNISGAGGTTIPIRALAMSAPAQMITAIPSILSQVVLMGEIPEQRLKECHKIVALYYVRFTALVIVNPEGRIQALANLPHGAKQVPAGFAARVRDEAVKLDNKHGVVLVSVQCGALDAGNLIKEIATAIEHDERFFPDALSMEAVAFSEQSMKAVAGTISHQESESEIPLECLMTNQSGEAKKANEKSQWVNAEVFDAINAASRQNFLKMEEQEEAVLPEREEMGLLGMSAAIRWIGVIGILLALGIAGIDVFMTVNGAAWNIDPYKEQQLIEREATLKQGQKAMEEWREMLISRSQAWAITELVSRLAPERENFIFSEVTTKIQIDTLQATSKSSTAGYTREITLSGLSKGSAASEWFSVERVRDIFQKTSELPEAGSLGEGLIGITVVVNTASIPPQTVGAESYNARFTTRIQQAVGQKSDYAIPREPESFPKNLNLDQPSLK